VLRYIISATLIQILQLLHNALYLPIHDIDLYSICFINVRSSPIGWFKWRPSVCLHHVVVNVPECGMGHCVHLHADSVCYSEQGYELYLNLPYIYQAHLRPRHHYRINFKKFVHRENGSSMLLRSIGTFNY